MLSFASSCGLSDDTLVAGNLKYVDASRSSISIDPWRSATSEHESASPVRSSDPLTETRTFSSAVSASTTAGIIASSSSAFGSFTRSRSDSTAPAHGSNGSDAAVSKGPACPLPIS